jgi:hypothetical protein
MKKKKIVSIDIELEDFEPIHLKMDEAKELYEQLHDLFGNKSVTYVPWYTQPWYYYSSGSPVWTHGQGTTSVSGSLDFVGKSVTSDNTGMTVSYNAA